MKRPSNSINRRAFISLASGALAWSAFAAAQGSSKRPLIGYLTGATLGGLKSAPYAGAFLQSMRELGYVEGQNFDIQYFVADGHQERLPALAEELVRLNPKVILATAVDSAVVARKATATIPIVSPALADAVHLGLVSNEARPGGNVTGVQPYVPGLPAKQMELVREVIPTATKIGILHNLQDPKAPPQAAELEKAGHALELKVISANANLPQEIDGALEKLREEQVDIVIVLQTTMLLSERQRVANLALSNRLPTSYGYREHVVAGGLISYGVDLRWCFQRLAYFVDKILHGTAPGDLPVEFPNKLELTVNVKTARTLGLTVPPTIIARADEVIE